MERILENPEIFTHSFCAFLSVRDLCCADVAVSSNQKLAPLMKALFQSKELRGQMMAMMMHMTSTEVINEAQLRWLLQRGVSMRLVALAPSTADAALRILSQAHRSCELVSLALVRCRLMSSAAIASLLQHCPMLTSLDLSGCILQDECLATIAQACEDRLRVLYLRGCPGLRNVGEVLAQSCASLTSLDLGGCRGVGDSALRAISQQCSALATLHVSHCDMSDTGIIALAHGCPALTSLDLSFCRQLGDAAMLSLAKACFGLQDLAARHCTRLSVAAVIALAQKCPSLARLDLSGCVLVTDVSLQALAQGSSQLVELRLRHVPVTDRGVAALARSCPSLTYLDLSCCSLITDAAVCSLATPPRPLLQQLLTRHCPGVSAAALLAFSRASPSFPLRDHCAVTIQAEARRRQAARRAAGLRDEERRRKESRRRQHEEALERAAAELAELQARAAEHQLQLVEAQQQRTHAQQQVAERDVEVAALKQSLLELKLNSSEASAALQANCEALWGRVEVAEGALGAARAEATELRQECVEHVAARRQQATDLEALSEELADVRASMRQRLEDLVRVSEEALGLRGQVAALRASKTHEVAVRAKTIAELRQEVAQLEGLRAEAAASLEEGEEEHEALAEELSTAQQEVARGEALLLWKTREYDSVAAERSELAAERDVLGAQLAAEEARRGELEAALDRSKSEGAAMAKELTECMRDLEFLLAENEALESKHAEADSHFLEALCVANKCANVKNQSQKILSGLKSERSGGGSVEAGAELEAVACAEPKPQAQVEPAVSSPLKAGSYGTPSVKPAKQPSVLKQQYLAHLAGLQRGQVQAKQQDRAHLERPAAHSQLPPAPVPTPQLRPTSPVPSPQPQPEVSSSRNSNMKSSSSSSSSNGVSGRTCSHSVTTVEMRLSGVGTPFTKNRPAPSPSPSLHEPDMSQSQSQCSPSGNTSRAGDSEHSFSDGSGEGGLCFEAVDVQLTMEDDCDSSDGNYNDNYGEDVDETRKQRDPIADPFSVRSRNPTSPILCRSRDSSRSRISRSAHSDSRAHQPADSVAYSRATSTGKLRVLGDIQSNKLRDDTHSSYQYIFHREAQSHLFSRARSPSSAARHRQLHTAQGLAAIGSRSVSCVSDTATSTSKSRTGGRSAVINKNSSRSVAVALHPSASAPGSRSPGRPLASLLAGPCRARNNIF